MLVESTIQSSILEIGMLRDQDNSLRDSQGPNLHILLLLQDGAMSILPPLAVSYRDLSPFLQGVLCGIVAAVLDMVEFLPSIYFRSVLNVELALCFRSPASLI